MLVAVFFSSWHRLPMTLDRTSWYFPDSAVTMLVFIRIAMYGFVIAPGGQWKFTDPMLD